MHDSYHRLLTGTPVASYLRFKNWIYGKTLIKIPIHPL